MARIEAGQNRDAGRAREWLARAARGAPDPTWMAPDGSVSAEWQAMSPSTGALGVLEWKTPPAAASPGAEDFIAEMSALDLSSIDAEPIPDATKVIPSSPPQEITTEKITTEKITAESAEAPSEGAPKSANATA
jgi:HemY protein